MSVNMWITDNQGEVVKGGSQIRGREGSIELIRVNHFIHLPFDEDSGTIQGTRKHTPFVVVKQMDSSSPFLAKACCCGQNLKDVRVDFYQINNTGQEVAFYCYILSDATVVSYNHFSKDGYGQQKDGYPPFTEEVGFIFKKIHWEYLDGHYANSDTWVER